MRLRRFARVASVLASTLVVFLVACADGEATLATEEAFGGVVFDLPVDLAPLPNGSYLLAQQSGEVLRVEADGSSAVILDLSDRVATGHEELGLLAVTPDPTFDRTGAFWVHYVADDPLRNVVARHTVDGDEAVVLEVPQPFENHNGGPIRFGPDGMLYVAIGDGGDAWDPLGHGQDPTTLLATVLRLDVSSEPGRYLVPADNPFIGRNVRVDARPEVWAYGLRNTWRFEFDEMTGLLWGGDVGQDVAEEVNVIRAGGNYGWRPFEGPECQVESCEGIDAIPPVAWYPHAEGCAVIGGFVYRGADLPVAGDYLYGDLCSGTIWALSAEAADGVAVESRVVAELEGPIVGFGRGHRGEVFVIRQGLPIVQLAAP